MLSKLNDKRKKEKGKQKEKHMRKKKKICFPAMASFNS